MLDRTMTLGRALVVALTLLVGLTWSSPAGADTSWHPQLLSQGVNLALHTGRVTTFDVSLATGGANGDNMTVSVTLYQHVSARSQLSSLFEQSQSPTSVLDSTGTFPLNCRTNGVAHFAVSVSEGAGTAQPTCGGAEPLLSLNCAESTCDGVYPMSYTLTNGEATETIWSLISATDGTDGTPLRAAWVFVTNPGRPTIAAETAALRALAPLSSTDFTIGANYHGLSTAAYGGTSIEVAYRRALTRVLQTTNHSVVASVPPSIDLATLTHRSLAADLFNQASFGPVLVSQIVSRVPDDPVILNGGTTPNDLSALATIGDKDLVLDDQSLTSDPAESLTWGEPFRVTNASANVLAVATDTPLANLASDRTLSPGLRSVMVLGTLDFLHFQAPYATHPRTVVIDVPLSHVTATFLRDVFAGLANDPVVTPTTLDGVFSPDLVGANGYPAQRTLLHVASPSWSRLNVASAAMLSANLSSYSESISEPGVVAGLQAEVLIAERRQSATGRQNEFREAEAQFQKILDGLKIDQSTITVTSTGTSLPITISSNAPYSVSGFLVLSAPHVTFSPNNIPLALDQTTRSLRISTTYAGRDNGDFTISAKFITPDQRLLMVHGHIQVHIVETSFIGYILTGVALAVIALWWLRTIRRSSKGRHAT